MTTTFFSFNNKDNADKFIGALLDHGATPADISVIARDSGAVQSAAELQKHAETGITTTTSTDFMKGAAAGTGVGLGIGVAAGLAALVIPGFGLVLGGGALATAIAGAAAATAGLALAGGFAGFMRDLGIEGEVPDEFERDYTADHVIVSVSSHADGIGLDNLEGLAEKYHATRTTLNRQVIAAVPVDTEVVKRPAFDMSSGQEVETTVEIRHPIGAGAVETVPVPPVVPIPGSPSVQPMAPSERVISQKVVEPGVTEKVVTYPVTGTTEREILKEPPVPLAEGFEETDAEELDDPVRRFYKA
jgi:hypothetical protein